ncbi:peroxisome biogenesis factor 1 [Protopterus annectens]|uniref:peroxisome biogenesis factor 1 n=1 Tax=Protopterus annectens TaxID=7888 RepID=UPI001CFA7164|nr:peroxisome biogenesis factor 1 [Protopterus annectens]
MFTGGCELLAVTLKFANIKNCFLYLSSTQVSQLRLAENQTIELSWRSQCSAFLSWVSRKRNSFHDENIVEISRHLGEKLGVQDGEQVVLKACSLLLSCQQVMVEPVSSDDWEILELHSSNLERQLLDQVRIVFPKATFPVWVDQHTVIYIKIIFLVPATPYGRLEPFTELIVTTEPRQLSSSVLHSSQFSGFSKSLGKGQLNSDSTEPNLQEPFVPKPSATLDTKETGLKMTLETHSEQSANIFSGIWSRVSSFFSGVTEEHLQVTDQNQVDKLRDTLSSFFQVDSAFRVCRSIPIHADFSNPSLNSVYHTVHVTPWTQGPDSSKCRCTVTYGRMSKLLSPKEQAEKSKSKRLESNKKKVSESSVKGIKSAPHSSLKENESCFVRIVWHELDNLKCAVKHLNNSASVHLGKIWISESLRQKMKIEISAAVRLRSFGSVLTVPAFITLQPIQTLPMDVTEDDIRAAFLSWLKSYSSHEVPKLATDTMWIQLTVKKVLTEFLLGAISEPPETENKNSELLFVLLPNLLQKTVLKITMQPLMKDTEANKAINVVDQSLPFLKLSRLGGVSELGRSAYEHIVHSLASRPLYHEFASLTKGLRNGAILLTGAKGSGKSTISRAICREASEKIDAHVEIIDCKKLRGKTFENIRKKLEDAFAEAVWRQPSVLLLDDLDVITKAALTPENELSPEAVLSKHAAQALKDMIGTIVSLGSLVALIATSQSEHSLHPSLVATQGTHLFQCFKAIHSPDQAQRIEILKSVILNKTNVAEEALQALDLHSVAKETDGFVARDFTVLVERAMHAWVLNNKSFLEQGLCLSTSDFLQAIKGFTPSALRNANLHKPKDLGWENVGGLHEVKQLLMDTIQLPAKYPVLFANLPIRHRSGVLLYGAPGTGKTLLAGVVARESGMNFISIKGPELLSKYIGASEQAVRDVFTRAQAARPCILFFDEFDSLAPRRGHDNTGVTDRVVNQLLTQLDGVEELQGVYVLAATSRPDLIDPALLRPGRLDVSVYCPPPDQASRVEILKALSQTLPLADDVDFKQIASMTEHFTGADLKALLYNAQLETIHTNLLPNLSRDGGSGSDSDVSLSSMIFLNHSSGSEDSAGEGDGGLEHSLVYLDPSEVPSEDPRPNVWRLYFGSSYESELGNGTPSELNSQCRSGPNSVTHDLTGTSLRDISSSQSLAFMASLQEGFQELNQEQTERLRAEINIIKANFRNRNADDLIVGQPGQSRNALVICQSHLMAALASTGPSISLEDWKNFEELYENFLHSRERRSYSRSTLQAGQKLTLA